MSPALPLGWPSKPRYDDVWNIFMDRRYFMTLLSSGVLVPQALEAEHHVISADPLEVEFDLRSLRGRYTAVEDFYIRNHSAAPATVDAATLKVEGEVEKPRELTPADLTPLRQREFGALLECAGNRVGSTGLISNGAFAGWPLKAVLDLARPTAKAEHLHFFGRDGYKRSVPLDRALAEGMLVTRLNSRPLPRQHGAPWRVVFPGWYGMDSVKWLERVVAAGEPLPPEGGVYQQTRRTPTGELERKPLPRVQVKSVIVDPLPGTALRRGRAEVRGLAWSGTGKIESVEVSADSGVKWGPATLDPGADFEWTVWKASLELTRLGAVEIVARAKDAKGMMQPPERDSTRLDGYANNWYHRVRCVVV
jgi:DMSO/TMAO reductase YedYZ molybdopterin-dependent catalytic subunit